MAITLGFGSQDVFLFLKLGLKAIRLIVIAATTNPDLDYFVCKWVKAFTVFLRKLAQRNNLAV